METPKCNEKYENYTLDKIFCKKNKVHGVFSKVTLKDWYNFNVIVTNNNAANSSTSL
jgi:hypothetical protein